MSSGSAGPTEELESRTVVPRRTDVEHADLVELLGAGPGLQDFAHVGRNAQPAGGYAERRLLFEHLDLMASLAESISGSKAGEPWRQ